MPARDVTADRLPNAGGRLVHRAAFLCHGEIRATVTTAVPWVLFAGEAVSSPLFEDIEDRAAATQ